MSHLGDPNEWKDTAFDATERAMMWAALRLDDRPRGGQIVIDDESEMAWDRACDAALGIDRASRWMAYNARKKEQRAAQREYKRNAE